MPSSLLTNLTEYWKLDESSGNRVGVNGIVLAPAGSPLPGSGTGIMGNGATFGSGATTNLVISPLDTTSFSPGMNSFSVAAWVNFTAVGADRNMVTKFRNTTGGFEWRLYYVTGTTHFRFQIVNDSAGSTSTVAESTTVPGTGTWYHVVGVYDATAAKVQVWVNGSRQSNVSANAAFASTGIFQGSGNFMIGNNSGGSVSTNGTLDGVGYWSHALTQTEITQLWQWNVPMEYPWFRSPVLTARTQASPR